MCHRILGVDGKVVITTLSSIPTSYLSGLSDGLWSRKRWNPWDRVPVTDNQCCHCLRCLIRSTGCSFLTEYSSIAPALSMSLSSLSPFKIAVLVNPFLQLVLGTFCGVTIPYPTMVKFWRSWIYPLDPYARSIAAMVSTELVSVKLYLYRSNNADYPAAVYQSDVRRTNLSFSILLLEKHACHGVKISYRLLVVTSIISTPLWLVDTASSRGGMSSSYL